MRGSRPIIGIATVHIDNESSSNRKYDIEIRLNGSPLGITWDEKVVKADGHETTSNHFTDVSIAGSQEYSLHIKSDSNSGVQNVEGVSFTVMEL